MHIGRAQTSETALKKIIVAIKDTLQKGSGKIAPVVKLSDMIILSPGSTGGFSLFCADFS
jgi:hypothetical protein